jgi:hypothetical protein
MSELSSVSFSACARRSRQYLRFCTGKESKVSTAARASPNIIAGSAGSGSRHFFLGALALFEASSLLLEMGFSSC